MSLPTKTSFTVRASRSPDSESVYVVIDVDKGGTAHFWLSRDQAYDLAQRLQHEADWLKDLQPELVS